MNLTRTLLTALLLLPLVPGCALLGKAEPANPVYLSPRGGEVEASEVRPSPPLPLRLRSVRAAEHLGRRLVVRSVDHGVLFLEEVRWTDPPADIVERRLGRRLFEAEGLTQVVGGEAWTLEVEVGAFELVEGDPPQARVELTCLFHDERRAVFRETFTVEEPAPGATAKNVGPAFADAIRAALDGAIDRLTARLVPALEREVASGDDGDTEVAAEGS